MMRHASQVLSFLLLVGIVFVAIACAAPAATPAPAAPEAAAAPTVAPVAEEPTPAIAAAVFVGEPIRLGLQAPLSGPQAAEGVAIKQAVELMVEQTNAAGGIDGREVVLLVEDDRGDPAAATQAAERLVDQKVVAVIGSATAATTDPASYVYNRAGVVHLMPSCALPLAIDKGFHRSFRVCFPEERTFQATADFVTEVIDATAIAVLHDGSPAAARLADGVQQAMARLGAQIVAYEAVSPNLADAPPLLEKLTTANPEVVYFAGPAATAAGLMKQARDAGVQVVWVLSNGANVPELASLIGPRGTASIYVVADPLPGQLADPLAQDFVDAYRQAFGAEPTLWGAMAADAVALVKEAVHGTNSADPQELAGYLHERLRGVPGITGQIEGFDSAGNRLGSGDVVLVLTPDGRLVPNQQQP